MGAQSLDGVGKRYSGVTTGEMTFPKSEYPPISQEIEQFLKLIAEIVSRPDKRNTGEEEE